MNIRHEHKESGIVSLLTVLLFSILISVLLTGFTRLMIQEQRDTLQDDLSKSAFNSAMAGVEDAKRAIQACAEDPSNVAGKRCAQLYNTECPGFNTWYAGDSEGPFEGVGVTRPPSSGTTSVTVGEPGANQRYTCVIVSKAPDIEADLSDVTEDNSSSSTYKLHSEAGLPFDSVEINWVGSDKATSGTLPSRSAVDNLGVSTNGNVRKPDWNHPAVLRVAVIGASWQPAQSIARYQSFLYPTTDGGDASHSLATPGVSSRYVTCDMNSTYACSFEVNGLSGFTDKYIVLQSFYKSTQVHLRLKNAIGQYIPMNGEQTSIDATGATNNVFRRVQARVIPGAPLSLSAALDTGHSVCKNFFVGPERFGPDPLCQ